MTPMIRRVRILTRFRIIRTGVFGHERPPQSNVHNKMQVVPANQSLVTLQRARYMRYVDSSVQ